MKYNFLVNNTLRRKENEENSCWKSREEEEKTMKRKVEKAGIVIVVLLMSMTLTADVPLACSSPGQIFIEGVFQPVQVVWQDDPLYPPNDMINQGAEWLANFSMVNGKNTFLFGTLNDLDGNRSTIDLWFSDLDLPPGIDYFVIVISVVPAGKPGTVIYVSSLFTIPRGGYTIVSLPAPIPIPPFIFQAGPGQYKIKLETVITPSVNQIIVNVKVVDTKPLKLIYFPYYFEGDRTAQGVVLPNGKPLTDMVRESKAFVLGTYPLWQVITRTNPLSGPEPNPPPFPNDNEAEKYLVGTMKKFQDFAAIVQGDTGITTQAVVVVPDYNSATSRLWSNKWYHDMESPGGAFIPSRMPNVVFVELGYWTTVAHEITHNILDVDHSDNRANGYWVDAQVDRNNRLDLMHALGYPDNTKFYQNKTLRWIKKRAKDNNATTVRDTRSSFEDLMNFFRIGKDPEALVVRGQIFKNGTVALDDWYRFSESLPNLELGTAGNYSVVMLDSMGYELGRVGFNATYVLEFGDLEPPKLVETDVCPFSFIIPWISGTTVIQIRNATENVLATRNVSVYSPSVSVTYPNGGEVLTPGLHTITWTADDWDGDPLSYAILYSDNNGTDWFPLDMDLVDTSYAVNVTNFLGGKNYLIKVIATDGVNTGEDVSDETFEVKTHEIAVSDVTPSKTVVGQGFRCQVNVTVQNPGYYAEDFNVTAFTNTTVIGTQTVYSLPSETSTTITLTWNTTGFAKGNYTIWAYAWPASGEADTTDNIHGDGWVKVTVPGDVTGEGLCDMQDIAILVDKFLAEPKDRRWDINCDVNDDLIIDMADISLAIDNFLKDP